MSTEAFPRRALGEALRDAIRARKVLAALFTTYSFDPGFFELHVLPLLFSRGFSKEDVVRKTQLDGELLSMPVAVYFDRGAVSGARGGGSLGLHAFGIRRATTGGATKGCFHPKLALCLVDDGDETKSLVVVVSSANLTEAGHWTNLECAWVDEVSEGETCSYAEDLDAITNAIRDEAALFTTKHESLHRIRGFIRSLEQARQRTHGGKLQPRLFYGREAFGDFLQEHLRLPPDTYHLEIISPFFDDGAALKALVAKMAPKTVKVYLPTRDDGAATCEKRYYDFARSELGAEWCKFVDPSYVRRSQKSADDARRTVHAKVYRLWSKAEGREYVVIGSVNLTDAAHSPKRAGNLEVAVILENPTPVLRPFLEMVDRPREFGAASEADDERPITDAICPLVLRFWWGARRLEAFWDSPNESAQLSLTIAGCRLNTEVEPLKAQVWIELPSSLANELAEHLPRTSLVQVHLPDADPAWTVVNEEDLAQKPSLLLELTVEEILRYWSALSDAQRQALLERADVRRAQGIHGTVPLGEADGMFERFAGIFHAFERLREHIEKAIEENRPEEAEYRLFGAKHDSLPSLLERVLSEESDDTSDPAARLAVRYVTVLSAQRLLRQLDDAGARMTGFISDRSEAMKRLQTQIDQSSPLRGKVAEGCGDDGVRFLEWFDDWFLGKRDRGDA